MNANSKEELIDELADIMEVVKTLAKFKQISQQDIEKQRLLKKEKRGGFTKRYKVNSVELSKNNPEHSYWIDYYNPITKLVKLGIIAIIKDTIIVNIINNVKLSFINI